MSVQMVLLPVFVLVGLDLVPAAVDGHGAHPARCRAGKPALRISRCASRTGPRKLAKIGNCFSNQFEVPVLFYVLIALALPLRHADFFIVLMSWVFVVTRFIHAGIFVTSNNVRQRGRPGSPACWCCSRCGSTSR